MTENTTGQQDSEQERDDVPNPETGVGLSMGEPTSFEPEEDPEAAAGGEDPQEATS